MFYCKVSIQGMIAAFLGASMKLYLIKFSTFGSRNVSLNQYLVLNFSLNLCRWSPQGNSHIYARAELSQGNDQ